MEAPAPREVPRAQKSENGGEELERDRKSWRNVGNLDAKSNVKPDDLI
jgi:hypothetical protein